MTAEREVSHANAAYVATRVPFPFVAHAWIEYRGEVINDVAEHVKWFAPLPEPLP